MVDAARPPLTAVVSVNWRAGALTCAMLDSLAQQRSGDWVALVCENGSPDDSARCLRDHLGSSYREEPRDDAAPDDAGVRVFDYRRADGSLAVSLVLSQRNLGFAGGNNLALKHAPASLQPTHYWFLNNDTELEPQALQHLLDKLAGEPQVGMCGATLVYDAGRDRVQAFGGARYQRFSGHVQEIGQGSPWPCTIDEAAVEAQLDYVAGASIFMRRDFLDAVGPMCEDYFLYYEEIDWAERARRAGYRLGYASRAVVYHKEGAVLGSGKSERRSLLAEYYALRNRLKLTRRFFPAALPSVLLFCWMQVLRRLVQRRWAAARLMSEVLLGRRKVAP